MQARKRPGALPDAGSACTELLQGGGGYARMAKPPADSGTASTTAQLSADINSGRTGDKVAGFDPAAAPLGTDDEAGGHPPTPEQIAMARDQETSGAASGHKANASEPAMTPDGVVNRFPGAAIWAVGLILLLLAAVVVIAVMSGD